MRRSNKILISLAVLAIALIALRLALPTIVKNYVNDALQALEEYDGHVEDVDIHLWRGAYRAEGVQIVKTGADKPVPFFSADAIDFSVEWKSLLRGAFVAQGVFLQPQINLVKDRTDEESQLGKDVDWAERIGELFPFRLNTVRVVDGRVTFTAPGIDTKDAMTAEDVDAEVLNLTNVADSGEETFAQFAASARVLGDAPLKASGRIDPLAEQPAFDVNLQVEKVQLPKLNPWLREYAKADAESGQFQLYLELAAADGKFKGYAKPLTQNVDIYRSGEPEENPFKRLWEGVIDFAANVLENEEDEQVAARVPFSGTIKNPDAAVLETIVSVLSNAFVSAFARSLEGSISLENVAGDVKLAKSEQKEKEERKEKEEKEDADADTKKKD